jgi:hypothetical protein
MERNPLQREKEVLSFSSSNFLLQGYILSTDGGVGAALVGCCFDQIRVRHSERAAGKRCCS